jgi:hypothetical protein
MNSWELRFDSISEGPAVIRGATKYFEEYLPLVRLARKYPVRYVLCTVALTELKKLPRSLFSYVIPGPMPFASPDIFGALAFHQKNLEDTVAHYARSRYLNQWLLVDSTYERRNVIAHDYTSLACDPVEGLQNVGLVASITQWLESSQKAS